VDPKGIIRRVRTIARRAIAFAPSLPAIAHGKHSSRTELLLLTWDAINSWKKYFPWVAGEEVTDIIALSLRNGRQNLLRKFSKKLFAPL
jgi:hypothetical protein